MDEDFSLDFLYIDHDIKDELFQTIRNGSSSQLDIRLNQLPNAYQYLRVFRGYDQQVSLLMIAASNGHDDIVRVLLSHDNTPDHVELKGIIIVSDQVSINGATALYCACYHGHFTVAKTLIEVGNANVNQDTDDHQFDPLFFHAIIMNRGDIIDFLLENRYADINETNTSGTYQDTALVIAARQGHTYLVEYLIAHGANVNYSCQHRNLIDSTALVCAVHSGHIDTARVLLHAGADASILKQVEDDLINAIIEAKSFLTLQFLLEQSFISMEQVELAVCSLIQIDTPMETIHQLLEFLKLTLSCRERSSLPKVSIESIDTYDDQQECQTVEELDSIKDDSHRIFIETLLIRERIALSRNDISIIEPLHSYGDLLVQRRQFEKGLNLLIHIFYLYQRMNITTTLHRFIWLFCQMMVENERIPVEWFLKVGQLVFEPSHLEEHTIATHNTLFLIIIGMKILEQEGLSQSDQRSIYSWVKDVCRLRLTTKDGRTFLHICVDAKTNDNIMYRPSILRQYLNFPNKSAFELLLACGSRWLDLDAVEHSNGNTPLHLFCMNSNNPDMMELLLKSGCHTDCVNRDGLTPFDYIKIPELKALNPLRNNPSKLKCLCAHLVVQRKFNIDRLGSSKSMLNQFVFLHGYELSGDA